MIIRERTGVALLAGAVVIAAVLAIVLRDGSNTRSAKVPWDHPVVERDLADIKKDTLRVLVLPDPWTWEVRPKAVTGLEYELLERFADREGLVIQAIPVEHPDSMFAALQHGRGDVIAAQFTLRKEQRGWVACTRTYHTARPMVARLREDPMREERVGPKDTIAISRWSPFVDATARRRGRSKLGHVRRVDGSPEEVLMDLTARAGTRGAGHRYGCSAGVGPIPDPGIQCGRSCGYSALFRCAHQRTSSIATIERLVVREGGNGIPRSLGEDLFG
ncbi:MAG: transporter substrate-binding domain-containing protein [Flavobacteriales bacterium]|nr:transporter substrate-binding domain-containing protein [Flavobacteriales bacterium]